MAPTMARSARGRGISAREETVLVPMVDTVRARCRQLVASHGSVGASQGWRLNLDSTDAEVSQGLYPAGHLWPGSFICDLKEFQDSRPCFLALGREFFFLVAEAQDLREGFERWQSQFEDYSDDVHVETDDFRLPDKLTYQQQC